MTNDVLNILREFGLPTALLLILIYFLSALLKAIGNYLLKREVDMQARLDAANKQMQETQEKFLAAYTTQNQIAATVATVLTQLVPIKENTDLLPDMSETVLENLKSTQRVVNMVRDNNKRTKKQ